MNELTLSKPTHPYIDTDNPQHFVNLLTPRFQKLILEIPHKYFEYPESRLIAEAFNGKPDQIAMILRLNFWEEYDRCFLKANRMVIRNIVDGTMNEDSLYPYLAVSPSRLMFIVTEHTKVKSRIKYAYHLALEEVVKKLMTDEMINMKTGLPDPGLMKVKLDLFKYLDQRLHGSIVQKMEVNQKTLQVNVDGNPQPITIIPDDLDERLAQLESELQSHNTLPPVMDVTPISLEKAVTDAGRITEEFKRG